MVLSVFGKKEEQLPQLARDFDLLEMPAEGVATYWLTLSRMLGMKKNSRILEEEAEAVTEPYIRHLLQLSSGGFDNQTFRRLSGIKEKLMLAELKTKFGLMITALSKMAVGENPRRILIKMLSEFSVVPVAEKEAIKIVSEMLAGLRNNTIDQSLILNVDHKIKLDQLICKLTLFATLSRRDGVSACVPLLKYVNSFFFADGLSLIIDGLESDFVRECLESRRQRIISDTRQKMKMSTDLCLGLGSRLAYEDMLKIAASYLS